MVAFRRNDTFINFGLVLDNQRGLKHLDAVIDAINERYTITSNVKQRAALGLIILNAIHFDCKPLIISLNNNSYKVSTRYNPSGVGITTFKNVYGKLREARLINVRYAALPSASAPQSTVIEVSGTFRQLFNDHAGQIRKYLRNESELIILRKNIKQYAWETGALATTRKSELCEYKENGFSRSARKFLKQYNSWIAQPNITFNAELANVTGLFTQLRQHGVSRDELLGYVYTYFQNRGLRRIFTAPDNYNPKKPKPLPELGGRFYGSFWQHEMPSEWRKYLLIDNQPCVELDFRAMNVTMLYFIKTRKAWESYPYEGIPLPRGLQGSFPKALVKPFFTWCLNVKSRKGAISLLKHRLLPELRANEESRVYEHFLRDNGITYDEFITSVLSSTNASAISQYFFTGDCIGNELQFDDSQILEMIMARCMAKGIYCLPIHDAILVKQSDKVLAKDIMIKSLCNYFNVPIYSEYVDRLIKEETVKQP